MTRTRLDRATIDDLLDKFEGKFGGIKPRSRSKYSSFVSGLKPKKFVDEPALMDYILLFSYVAGDRLIVERDGGKERRIKGLEDLTLLSYLNTTSKNKQRKRNNPELYRLYGRICNRHYKLRALSWHQTLDKLFKEKEVVKYLGAEASYEEHVIEEPYTEKEDYELLKQYVLGKKLIVDHNSPKRRKRIKSLKDLYLLSNSNVVSKNKQKGLNNPELYELCNRIGSRPGHHKWQQTLDKIFKEKEVVKYLGAEASYKQHVVEKPYTKKGDYELLKQYVLGKEPIVDGYTGKRKRIKSLKDLYLLSDFIVVSKNQQEERNNPELFRLQGRIISRQCKSGALNWSQTLDKLFKEKEIIKYLGAEASYKQHVRVNKPYTEKEDYELLKEYVLGKKLIVDHNSPKRRKRIKSLKDLTLLVYSNLEDRSKRKMHNPELFDLYKRIGHRYYRHGTPNWQQTLDKLFKEKEVKEYLGAKATYGKYVRVIAPKN